MVKRFGDDDTGRRVATFVASDGTFPVVAVAGIDLDVGTAMVASESKTDNKGSSSESWRLPFSRAASCCSLYPGICDSSQ